MPLHRPVDAIDVIASELRNATFYGANAHDLFKHMPALVDILCPSGGGVSSAPERAVAAEGIISSAISAVALKDSREAEALLILLRLRNDSAIPRGKRREEAARLLKISAQTLRKKTERELFSKLAFEIWIMSV